MHIMLDPKMNKNYYAARRDVPWNAVSEGG